MNAGAAGYLSGLSWGIALPLFAGQVAGVYDSGIIVGIGWLFLLLGCAIIALHFSQNRD